MKIALIVVAVLAILVLAVVAIGWTLPVAHRATSEASFSAPPEAVYALLVNVDAYPAWRADVKKIDLVAAPGAHRSFRETGSNGPILFQIEEEVPYQRFVTRIADKSLPFGGTWTYEISPAPGGSTLRITEDGEVYNPVFRFVSRFIMGRHGTMNAYLKSAGRKFGSTVVIRES